MKQETPIGATILRIKTLGKIRVNEECENICSHSDIIVKDDIKICLSEDAKVVSDLDKLKQAFDAIGIPYEEGGNAVYHTLCMTSLGHKTFFEFLDGKSCGRFSTRI